MNKVLVIIGIIAVVAVGWFTFSRTGQRQNLSPNITVTKDTASTNSEKSPNFSLQDYSGKTVKLSDFAGKPLVLNAWAAWCPFCREELLAFATAQKEFGDKVVIIAIDRAESLRVAKGYTDQQGTTNSLIFLLDPSDSFYQSIGGFSMPETIFVDKNGNIAEHKRGPMDINEMRQKIQKLISS